MDEENNETVELIQIPGSTMAMPADLVGDLADLALSSEEMGGELIDMLAIYKNSKGRWQTGETKKDELVGIHLHTFGAMRNYWPPVPGGGLSDTPPVCWSFGGEGAGPVPECAEPQSETCETCPWNQFGTAEKGRGKGCKTKRADFFIEVDPSKLTYDGKIAQLSADAVLGLALVRASATAKETRRSVGAWAKDISALANGVASLVLTRWTLADVPGSAGDFSAPILDCLGSYVCDVDSLEEIVDMAKRLRAGEGKSILTVLAGRVDATADGTPEDE